MEAVSFTQHQKMKAINLSDHNLPSLIQQNKKKTTLIGRHRRITRPLTWYFHWLNRTLNNYEVFDMISTMLVVTPLICQTIWAPKIKWNSATMVHACIQGRREGGHLPPWNFKFFAPPPPSTRKTKKKKKIPMKWIHLLFLVQFYI